MYRKRNEQNTKINQAKGPPSLDESENIRGKDLNPWTKKDGILTALVCLWYNAIQNNEKYIHGSLLIDFGFKNSHVYEFLDRMIRQGYVKSYKEGVRSLKYFITPTPTGLTHFLKFYQKRSEQIQKSSKKHNEELFIESMRLKITCETLEKIQSSLFGNVGK